jgi:heat shock protein HslJ
MDDLERSVRQTLVARVSHLTDERLTTDLPTPAPRPAHGRSARTVLLPLAAAAAVVTVVVGVLVAVRSGGHGHPAASPPPGRIQQALSGTKWQLRSITLDGHTRGGAATIIFDREGHAGGNDGCNSFSADVSISGSTIRFSRLGGTLKACLGPPGEIEAMFMAALPNVDHWSAANGTLELTGPGGLAMTFVQAAPSPPGVTPLAKGLLAKGQHNGADFVFAYTRSSDGIGLSFEWTKAEVAAGTGLGFSRVNPAQLDAGCEPTGGQSQFVLGWTRVKAAKVVYQVSGKTPVALQLYPIQGFGTLVVFGGFVEQPGANAAVTAYSSGGTALAHKQLAQCS